MPIYFGGYMVLKVMKEITFHLPSGYKEAQEVPVQVLEISRK